LNFPVFCNIQVENLLSYLSLVDRETKRGKYQIPIWDWELNMAGGWTRDGGVQDQIDASIDDAVKQARSRLPEGESLEHCEKCEEVIPEARRKAIPGVRLCVSCQSELEKGQTTPTGFNRRGSKDSQLK
jgi:phage/conjugal plasmid C-4 type zinc finger TraR family protein